MIERKNIIQLLGDRTNVYHSAVLTCFTFDPIFFESIYLPTLHKLGVTNVVVLMDSSMYDRLLSDSSYKYHQVSTNNYTLVRQSNMHGGVFHPKMVLLFGEDEGALIVGSGNLTFSGMMNNEEVWNAFHVKGDNSPNYSLLKKTWLHFKDITQNVPSLVSKQLSWITEQSIWVEKDADEDMVILSSGDECSLLLNTSETKIVDSIYSAIGDTVIEEITVVAPFYDAEGNALTEVQTHFKPKIMKCIIDVNRKSAPFSLMNEESNIYFYKHTASNPLHAKIIEFQGEDETWLLNGSANAGTLALGMNESSFNDEACVLLHSKKRKNYIKELGLEFSALNVEERKLIDRPQQSQSVPNSLRVSLLSCEEKDNKLFLRFNKNGIKGSLSLCDNHNSELLSVDITTKKELTIGIDESTSKEVHVVFMRDGELEISNRTLVLKEFCIESCNPDPKRRKLASLLDDTSLRDNLSHILGYIEFDDTETHKSKTMAMSSKEKTDDETIVTRDRFETLKDSKLSVNLHSGVRILSYLKQILFKEERTEKVTEDGLMDRGDDGAGNTPENEYDVIETVESMAENANKMRADIVSYLSRMQQFMIKKTSDVSIHGEVNSYFKRPKLLAIPGLNAASSLAVATRSVVFLMNKYGLYVSKSYVLRDLLIKCAGLFLSLYGNEFPSDDDKIRNRKICEIIKDGTVDLLSAISFFGFKSDHYALPQLILNCLDPWKGRMEINEILSLYEEQLTKLNSSNFNENTINRIRNIAELFINHDTPIEFFSEYDNTLYVYRTGHGFLVVDNLKHIGDKWNCIYHSPWFDELCMNSSATKYKGYADL